MKIERSSGILMHITSLPGKYGIGTLGEEAYRFVDMLCEAGQSYWQILPFHPVCKHLGYSPYASTSTFAGNIFFINYDSLKKYDWFDENLIPADAYEPDNHFVDYHKISEILFPFYKKLYGNFKTNASVDAKHAYDEFCKSHSDWLEDFATFIAFSDYYHTKYWPEWDSEIAHREPHALNKMKDKLADEINLAKFLQYLFFEQWHALKKYSNEKGIKIIGDIPIYISIDSADAWANRSIFDLNDETCKPSHVSGVPPDYFSENGQLWGNPLYNWYDEKNNLREDTFNWWVKRLKHLESMVDIIRIDHFRAFEAYWSVPADETTAINGKWIKGPGEDLFNKLNDVIGKLPLIAEDLGVITPEVEALRDQFEFPGMKILQFAFDKNEKNSYLPQNLENPNCILYTGTHDNNTTNGWYYEGEVTTDIKKYIKKYMDIRGDHDFHKHLISLGMSSVARLFILPTQDILGYGSEFRFNTPGTMDGNWKWKLAPNELTNRHLHQLKEKTRIYNRLPQNSKVG